MTEDEVTREIERYVAWPGQACSYKVGELTILRLRERARTELGDRFDIRAFHEEVLMNGGLPLGVLEQARADVKAPYWFGESIGHADIAVACVLRFVGEAHPLLFDARYPALKAHSARCEALPPFREIVQPLEPPKG